MADGHAHDQDATRLQRDFHAPADLPDPGPIAVSPRQSAAIASQPGQELDDQFQVYEANPAPWWVGLLWLAYLIGGATYLFVNLTR